MAHTITEQISISPLGSNFLVCPPDQAIYQYECYHTDKSPIKIIAAVAEYNNKFSYAIGETVDVTPHLYVARNYRMNNVIISKAQANQGR